MEKMVRVKYFGSLKRRTFLSGLCGAACLPMAFDYSFNAALAQGANQFIRHARGAKVPVGLRTRMQLQDLAASAIDTKFSADPVISKLITQTNPTIISSSTSPPSRFDWRDTNKVTPVKNQGSCGSCYIFATLAAFESAYLIANNTPDPNTIEVSEQEILDCGIAETNCVVGGWHEYVLIYLQTLGAVGSATYPYNSQNPQRGVFCNSNWGNRPYYLRNWSYVSAVNAIPSVDILKQAIVTKGPVVSGVTAVSDGSSRDWDLYSGGVIDSIPSTSDDRDIDHEVVIVGWDDSLNGNGVPPGAWIVKNSWGTDWGGQEKGYIKVPYDRNNIGFGASWVSAWSAASLAAMSEQQRNTDSQQKK